MKVITKRELTVSLNEKDIKEFQKWFTPLEHIPTNEFKAVKAFRDLIFEV